MTPGFAKENILNLKTEYTKPARGHVSLLKPF